ncbi:MAG: hypothetical protein GY751_06525, partial [Bacteroidetes bacterium]|nr:hypothetical protein [Bacteroidota bacterium]
GSTFESSLLTTHTFIGLEAGYYEIMVMDDSGCTDLNAELIQLNEPAGGFLIIDVVTINNNSCFGDNDGVINILVSGGSGPYTYSVDGGVTTSTSLLTNQAFVGLSPGTYLVMATDANGCSVGWSEVVEITGPSDELGISAVEVMNDPCEGSGNGEIVINLYGGDAPYEYSIDGGATSESSFFTEYVFSDLISGDYIVSVTDANGCQVNYSLPVNINEAADPIVLDTVLAEENNNCFGDIDGEITIEVSGGLTPYEYSIDGGLTFTSSSSSSYTFNGLGEGIYSVVVQDANGCLEGYSDILVFEEPEAPLEFVEVT